MPICPSKQPDEKTSFAVGGLSFAGLEGGETGVKCLFFREEAVELWKTLDSFKCALWDQCVIRILGSPGIGKSSEVWAWLCCQNMNQDHDEDNAFALWVHINLQGPLRCVILRKSKMMWKDCSEDEACAILLSINVRFMVLDGCRNDEPKGIRVNALLNLQGKRKMGTHMQGIFVSSMSEKTNTADDDARKIFKVEVAPWRLEQQLEACKDPEFLQSVIDKLYSMCAVQTGAGAASAATAVAVGAGAAAGMALQEPDAAGAAVSAALSVEDLVKEKHYYAGGNVRWMFAYARQKMLDDIGDKLRSVPNKRAMLEGLVGVNSQQAVNHLMIRYKEKNGFKFFLTSKYIARETLKACEASAFRVAYTLAHVHHLNPAFLGWIVEFDLITQMEQCKGGHFEFVNASGKFCGTRWDVNDVIDFDPKEDVTVSSMPVGTWLKPVKWNQEGYDLVSLRCDHGRHYLRFVQITNAAEHVANLVQFKLLADKVKSALGQKVGVEIFLVSPQDFRGKVPTKINIKNDRALSNVAIGSTDSFWSAANAESSIQRLFFKAERNS